MRDPGLVSQGIPRSPNSTHNRHCRASTCACVSVTSVLNPSSRSLLIGIRSGLIGAARASRPAEHPCQREKQRPGSEWEGLGKRSPIAGLAQDPMWQRQSGFDPLGAALNRHQEARPRPAATICLLTLTGTRVFEVLHLAWSAIDGLDDDGASALLTGSKTGLRTT